jgi:hypothetical protein
MFIFPMCTQQGESHLYKLPFKIRTRKTKLSLESMVSGLCSVLITECEDLGIQGLAPLSELQTRGRAGLYEFREELFAYHPAIACSGVGVGQKVVLIVDVRHQSHSCVLQCLTICGSFIFTFFFG